MLGRFAVLLSSLAVLGLIAVISISCGSSTHTTTKACTGGPFDVVGPWQITVNDNGGGSVTGFGGIDSAGQALFFDTLEPTSAGDTLQLPTVTGACSFSGNITAYGEPGGPNNGSIIIDAVQGNVNSATSISGTFSGNSSGTISVAPFSPLAGSVTAVTGTMIGEGVGAVNSQSIFLVLTFSQSGSNDSMSFTTTNLAGCEASGTFTQQGTTDVFDVSITYQAGCPIVGTFTGIGFESDTDYFNFNGNLAGTYLYADILANANTFVLEIFSGCAECKAGKTAAPSRHGAKSTHGPIDRVFGLT
jgi:hypothetical protein